MALTSILPRTDAIVCVEVHIYTYVYASTTWKIFQLEEFVNRKAVINVAPFSFSIWFELYFYFLFH